METRILRLEDEFWRIRTDTGELAETERNALRAYLINLVLPQMTSSFLMAAVPTEFMP